MFNRHSSRWFSSGGGLCILFAICSGSLAGEIDFRFSATNGVQSAEADEGGSHFMIMENPGRFSTVVRAFLNR